MTVTWVDFPSGDKYIRWYILASLTDSCSQVETAMSVSIIVGKSTGGISELCNPRPICLVRIGRGFFFCVWWRAAWLTVCADCQRDAWRLSSRRQWHVVKNIKLVVRMSFFISNFAASIGIQHVSYSTAHWRPVFFCLTLPQYSPLTVDALMWIHPPGSLPCCWYS